MKQCFLFVLACCGTLASIAGDPKYPVSAIPAELKKDANAVVREEDIAYVITSQSKVTYTVHLAVTVLNPNGKDYADLSLYYDKLRKISSFKGAIYDGNGMLIKKLKSSEIQDRSAFDGYSLFSDNRLKVADLTYSGYPYTVEFDYEIEYKYLYSYLDEYIIPDEKTSVQHFSYQLTHPVNLPLRYKLVNAETKPDKRTDGDMETITWSFTNLKPILFEPYAPAHELPEILVAPTVFEYEGYVGNMSTWEEYGKWNGLLNKDRDVLPEATRQKIKTLTNRLTTTEQKAKVIYEYLQSKTRYVSISLGIGGLQPFPASVVDQVGYGDCKALSNYMVAMLKEVGVKGYYTTVRSDAGEPQVREDFPSHQSNHAIVSIPNGADTIWLECTSQTAPFNYMGRSTANRKALMITEAGGKLVNTRRYTAEQNVQSRSADVYVENNGNAKAKIKTVYKGLQYENDYLNFILDNQYDDQKKWVEHHTSIPSFNINSFSMMNRKEGPSAIVDLDLTLNRFASVNGKRLFFTPNLMNRSTLIPEKVDSRKTNVMIKLPYTDLDTIRFHLPEGIYPEFLPEPIKITSRFGEYESRFVLEQNNLVYIRRMKRYKGEYPPETYQELTDFYRSINKADNTKMVFLNKT